MLPRCTVASARRWLVLTLAIGMAFTASAAVYISPSGSGNLSGSDANNAKPASLLQNEIMNLSVGETIYLVSGTYTNVNLSIVGSGTAGSPKRIVGLPHPSTGVLPIFQGTYDVEVPASSTDYLFKFVSYGGAATSHWEFKDFRVASHGFVFDMPLNGESFTLRQNIVFDNVDMDNIEDGIRIRNAEYVTVRNCSIIRHTKKAFRIGFFSRFVTFEDCDTDANGGDDTGFPTRSIPVGFGTDSPDGRPIIHDIRLIECSARNNRFIQSSSDYWNGDGFSSERGVYNVTYSRCISMDNHDGGFDDKATNTVYENCIALGNKRGFRIWSAATLINCLSVNNTKWGGNSNSLGLWAGSSEAVVNIYRSTFNNNDNVQILNEGATSITAYDSILSVDANGSTTAVLTSGTVGLSGSIRYRNVDGGPDADPQYAAPSNTWHLTPPNAYNTAVHPTKGYFYQGTATTAPAAPSAATATINAAQANHIDLTWTDNATNEQGFTIQRSTNGGAYVTLGTVGTNVSRYMDTGLAYATSYSYRIYAYNNIGSSSAYASVSRSTASLAAPTTPTGLTATVVLDEPASVSLVWSDNASNESSYEVQRSIDGTNFTTIATLPENSTFYTDEAAAMNTTFYYRVRALNSAGTATSSNQSLALPWVEFVDNLDTAKVEILPNPEPTPPVWVPSALTKGYWGTNYHANTTSGTPASFGFVPAIPATAQYQVYLRWTEGSNRASNVPVDIIHAAGTATVPVNQKFSGGSWQLLGTYSFNAGTSGKIVIRNTGVNGAVIADAVRVSATTTTGPASPSDLVATATGATTIGLTWTDRSSNETSFSIERSVNGGSFSVIGSAAANATTFSDTAASAGINYSYRVRAIGSAPGGASNTATAFTAFSVILDNVPSTQVVHSPSAWTSANLVSGAYNNEYVHDDNSSATIAKMIVFRPTIPGDGTYQVAARWTAGSNRASNVRYLVTGSVGRLPFLANQKYSNNTWITLGTVTLRSGTGGSVLLVNEGANGYVIGDAVRFTRVAP